MIFAEASFDPSQIISGGLAAGFSVAMAWYLVTNAIPRQQDVYVASLDKLETAARR